MISRFCNYIAPGETIEYSFWKENNQILFSGTVLERNCEAIYGAIDIKE
jgi:hypothetical protein